MCVPLVVCACILYMSVLVAIALTWGLVCGTMSLQSINEFRILLQGWVWCKNWLLYNEQHILPYVSLAAMLFVSTQFPDVALQMSMPQQ